MHSREFDSKRDKLLSDYIVQKALMNATLRDEILVQVVNQTWSGRRSEEDEQDEQEEDEVLSKAWHLMSMCLSCFSPSACLYKYLLKYVSDHAPNDACKAHLQLKLLLGGEIEPALARTYPPSFAESMAAPNSNMIMSNNIWRRRERRRGGGGGRDISPEETTSVARLALHLDFADEGERMLCEVHSWSTGEDLCRVALGGRGLSEEAGECNGWTLSLQDDNDF